MQQFSTIGRVELTKKQAVVLVALRDMLAENGYAPTLRELGRRIEKSHATVHKHLFTLDAKGFIHWDTGIARGIVLTERGRRWS